MVTRKPVPVTPVKTSLANANPPYPASPVPRSARTEASANSNSVYSTDLHTSPAFDLIDVRDAQQQRARSDSGSSHGTWDSEGSEREDEGDDPDEAVVVPKPLNIKSTPPKMNGDTKVDLPPSLRIGAAQPTVSSPTHGYEDEAQANPWQAEQMIRSPTNSKNPYLKQNSFVGDSSQAAWREVTAPPLPPNVPPPIPSAAPPPPPPPVPSFPTSPRPAQEQEHSLPIPITSEQNRPSSTWWQDSDAGDESASAFAEPEVPAEPMVVQEEQYHPPPGPPPKLKGSLIDHEDAPSSKLTPINTSPSLAARSLPPRSPDAVPSTPGSMLQKQRNTTYQIKHVNWLDESYDGNSRIASQLRNSPIMTQNANGPCPLLALVNALVLSTPADVDTPLLQVLGTREQISLGLLLDAVFDELTSARRNGESEQLPDVSELYSFLLALHSGMNVNPRFVTPAATPRGSWDGVPPELNGMHPLHKAQHKAGAFEETKGMTLYSTFGIPLIHGWTPPNDTPAYEAFSRSAQTFEDAQNIQFMQSDLEDKMRLEGFLTPQETQILEDIHVIKSFLATWPTQLTDYGLETMSKSLQPGQIAILFRNDHFSTLYKEPKHGALMTLVTDAGYAGHDELVWESLVDVSGAASEMFSGDFRVVSHGSDVRLNQGNSAGGEEGWTTVEGKSRRKGSRGEASSPVPPPLPGPRPAQAGSSHNENAHVPMTDEQRRAAEQQDHDLALALQLQEEEENHERQADERRRREQELSEQYLSNESEGPRPPIPPRRSQGRGTGATVGNTPVPVTSNTPGGRAPVNRPSDSADDADAPPSYEQAASDPPYRPAGSTASASLSQGNAIGAYDALRRQQSAYAQQSTASLPSFAQVGPSSPPYSVNAAGSSRPSGPAPNRVKRQSQSGGFNPGMPQRTNQIGFGNPVQRSAIGQGGLSPGHHPRSSQARSMARLQEVHGAPAARDAEERCVVM